VLIITLEQFFKENSTVALAFSGGVDSSYLLYAGLKYGADVKPYFIKTAFQPEFELEDAYRIAEQVGVDITVLQIDILTEPLVVSNPDDRCFHCKTRLFQSLKQQAAADGYSILIDGTNASDDATDRPGMRALTELSVRSPLRECGITKDEVRCKSKEAGLFTWDKPAYACLATRIPTGREITAGLLSKVEQSEDILFSMGFTDFRVRVYYDAARIQIPVAQIPAALEKREAILNEIKQHFPAVLLDLTAR